MLIVNVFANHTELESIYIQNMGKKNEHGETLYQIQYPDDLKGIQLWHTREDGQRMLVLKVYQAIFVKENEDV